LKLDFRFQMKQFVRLVFPTTSHNVFRHCMIGGSNPVASPAAVGFTASLVWIGLRGPRPRLRRLVHEAGWSACLAAIVVHAVRTIAAIASWGADRARVARFPWPSCVAVFDDLELYVGPAIVAVWVAIALGRRCRWDWSSIGWLTLIAGTSWVILIFKGLAITVLAPL
jgi:hypothetical protein